MDYQAMLYNPQYAVQGVDAVLVLADTAGTYPLRVLDKTAGVNVGDRGAEVQTIKPVASARVRELTAQGVSADDLPDASIAFNDASWKIVSTRFRPSPNGVMDGEVYMILSERTPLDSEFESESA